MKKKAFIIIPILLAILIIAGVGIGIHISNNQPAPTENEPTNEQIQPVEDEITEPATEIEKPEFIGDFVPFECNGDYTYFVHTVGKAVAQNGTIFNAWSTTAELHRLNTLSYQSNGVENILFSFDSSSASIYPVAYIDDSLYFNISDSGDMYIDGFYRMWFKYDESGDIADSGVSFLLKGFLQPVRAENNALILTSVDGGRDYIVFDTETGDYKSIDYNTEVDFSEVSDKITIDLEKAVDIASKELENIKYYDMTDHVGIMNYTGDNTLIYRPDYVYKSEQFVYDLYPEYAWRISFKGEFRGNVYVNAITGEVAYVTMEFLD